MMQPVDVRIPALFQLKIGPTGNWEHQHYNFWTMFVLNLISYQF